MVRLLLAEEVVILPPMTDTMILHLIVTERVVQVHMVLLVHHLMAPLHPPHMEVEEVEEVAEAVTMVVLPVPMEDHLQGVGVHMVAVPREAIMGALLDHMVEVKEETAWPT